MMKNRLLSNFPRFTAEVSLDQNNENKRIVPAQQTAGIADNFNACYDACMQNTCARERAIYERVGTAGSAAITALLNCLHGIEDRCTQQCMQSQSPQPEQPSSGWGQPPPQHLSSGRWG